MRPIPEPDAEGSWGPVFRTALGQLLPAVDVYAMGHRSHLVEVRSFVGDGLVVTSRQGPYVAAAGDRTFEIPLVLPAEIGDRIARVTVVVEPVDTTGRPLSRRATRAWAWRDRDGVVQLVDEQGARAALAVAIDADDDIQPGMAVSR